MKLSLTVIIEPAEEGGFCGWIAEFPDIHSQGETEAECEAMVLSALADMMESRREQGIADAKAKGWAVRDAHFQRYAWGSRPVGWGEWPKP